MRRVLNTPDFRAGFVEMLPACLGLIPFGLVCGVGAAAAGADLLGALGMSAIIFSGAAQILASQLLADGAPVAVVILTCAVLGLRFLMYSAAMAPALRTLSAPWQRAVSFLLTDQVFAASIRKFDPHGDPRPRAPARPRQQRRLVRVDRPRSGLVRPHRTRVEPDRRARHAADRSDRARGLDVRAVVRDGDARRGDARASGRCRGRRIRIRLGRDQRADDLVHLAPVALREGDPLRVALRLDPDECGQFPVLSGAEM